MTSLIPIVGYLVDNETNRAFAAGHDWLTGAPWPDKPPGAVPMPCNSCGGDTWFGPGSQEVISTAGDKRPGVRLFCIICAVIDTARMCEVLSEDQEGTKDDGNLAGDCGNTGGTEREGAESASGPPENSQAGIA